MDKNELYYKIANNKSKILLILSVLFTLLVIGIGIFIIKRNNSYEMFDNVSSKKYVLADNIIGASRNGKVRLYSSKSGKITDSISLPGEYLIDTSDDFKNLYMLNIENGDFYILDSKNDKINKTKQMLNLKLSDTPYSFDYDNNLMAILCEDKKSFLVKSEKSNSLEKFVPDVIDDIDMFRISNGNLVFTSGEFIYSKSLSNDISNSENVKVTQVELKLRDKENIHGKVISSIPAGERVEIIGEGTTGWYLVKYNNFEGYVSNASTNFEDSTTLDGGVVKIHIGEKSNFIHEFGKRLFIHNDFGKGRGHSILVELNPENLYIKNVVEYKSPTNTLISNIKDKRLYINEIAQSESSKTRQIIKFKDIDDVEDRLGFKYTSETILDSYNAYGSFGYVYYRDNKGVNIYNLKSQEKDLTIKISDDLFMPLY